MSIKTEKKTKCFLCVKDYHVRDMIGSLVGDEMISPYLGPNLTYMGPHCIHCHRRIEDRDIVRIEDSMIAEIRAGIMNESQLDDFRKHIQWRRGKGECPLRGFAWSFFL